MENVCGRREKNVKAIEFNGRLFDFRRQIRIDQSELSDGFAAIATLFPCETMNQSEMVRDA